MPIVSQVHKTCKDAGNESIADTWPVIKAKCFVTFLFFFILFFPFAGTWYAAQLRLLWRLRHLLLLLFTIKVCLAVACVVNSLRPLEWVFPFNLHAVYCMLQLGAMQLSTCNTSIGFASLWAAATISIWLSDRSNRNKLYLQLNLFNCHANV